MPGSWSDYLELRSGDTPHASSRDGSVRVYADSNGDLREIKSDGTDAPIGGGGGIAPADLPRGVFGAGDPTSIADGATGYLLWDDQSPTTQNVVDLSDSSAPAVLADGVYAVRAGVSSDAMSVDGFYVVQLRMDASGDSIISAVDSRLAAATAPFPKADISDTYFIPAGGTIRVRIQNNDGGAATLDFSFDLATIQRVA